MAFVHDVPCQFIAPQPAAFAGQGQFTVKAAHAVTPAEAEFVLLHQWRKVPLGVPVGVKTKGLVVNAEGVGEIE